MIAGCTTSPRITPSLQSKTVVPLRAAAVCNLRISICSYLHNSSQKYITVYFFVYICLSTAYFELKVVYGGNNPVLNFSRTVSCPSSTVTLRVSVPRSHCSLCLSLTRLLFHRISLSLSAPVSPLPCCYGREISRLPHPVIKYIYFFGQVVIPDLVPPLSLSLSRR